MDLQQISQYSDLTHQGPCLLFIAGGSVDFGMSRFRSWQKTLSSNGINSFAFNFPGVESAKGNVSETSLSSRAEMTKDIINYLNNFLLNKKIFVFGTSMGGYIALSVLSDLALKTNGLILDAPAAYAQIAENIEFGTKFSSLIRKQNSWMDSRSFKWLRSYASPILFIEHEYDEIIPKPITKKYQKNLKTTDRYIMIKDLPHDIWSKERRQEKSLLLQEILRFISQQSTA